MISGPWVLVGEDDLFLQVDCESLEDLRDLCWQWNAVHHQAKNPLNPLQRVDLTQPYRLGYRGPAAPFQLWHFKAPVPVVIATGDRRPASAREGTLFYDTLEDAIHIYFDDDWLELAKFHMRVDDSRFDEDQFEQIRKLVPYAKPYEIQEEP